MAGEREKKQDTKSTQEPSKTRGLARKVFTLGLAATLATAGGKAANSYMEDAKSKEAAIEMVLDDEQLREELGLGSEETWREYIAIQHALNSGNPDPNIIKGSIVNNWLSIIKGKIVGAINVYNQNCAESGKTNVLAANGIDSNVTAEDFHVYGHRDGGLEYATVEFLNGDSGDSILKGDGKFTKGAIADLLNGDTATDPSEEKEKEKEEIVIGSLDDRSEEIILAIYRLLSKENPTIKDCEDAERAYKKILDGQFYLVNSDNGIELIAMTREQEKNLFNDGVIDQAQNGGYDDIEL